MRLHKKNLLPLFLAVILTATLSNVRPVSSTTTTMSVDPRILHANVGESIHFNLSVTNVEYLYAWQVNMSFNPDVLRFVDVTEGDFLEDMPQGTSGFSRLDHIEDGWLLFGWTSQGEFPGESGAGDLAAMEFEVLDVGESPLRFEGIGNVTYLWAQTAHVAPPIFYDIEFTPEHGLFTNVVAPPVADFTYSPEIPTIGGTITFDASASSADSSLVINEYFWEFGDGTNATVTTPTIQHAFTTGGLYRVSLTVFDNATASQLVKDFLNTTAMPRIWYELYSTKQISIGIAFSHDVAVTNVALSTTNVAAGETVSIDVTVLNKGVEPEDFEVTAYYDTNEIDTEQVDALEPEQEETISFSWDTTGVAAGSYKIKARASEVEGEGNTEDNEFIDGTIVITEASTSFPTTLVIGGAIGGVVVLVVIYLIYSRRKGAASA
ncbi:MAG: PKD domain-containing protein [Candidatus Bathyarchaeota archaeon]|jgi:hypothetical protein